MSSGLVFVSMSFLILMISFSSPIPIIGMVIFGIGHGMVFPTSAGIVRNNSDAHNRGVATGTFYALVVAGIAIGAPISGLLYELYGSQIMFLGGMLFPFVSAIVIFVFFRKID